MMKTKLLPIGVMLVVCGAMMESCVLEDVEKVQCESGLNECGSICVDILTNVQHCGACNYECSESDVEGGSSFKCEESLCKATFCKVGYHIFGDYCEKDSNASCGAHDAPCDATVQPHGTKFSCDNGECRATSCENGYHLFEGICESHSYSN